MSGQQYEQEVMWQLSDIHTYTKLTGNPLPAIVYSLNQELSFAFEAHLITKKELDHLLVGEFNTPTLYTILKLHKSLTNPPGRQIISVIKGPLERIGKYMDALIKQLVYDLPSFVRDTRDVLSRFEDVPCPGGALLIGIDVESLYTHRFPMNGAYKQFTTS